MVELLAVTFDAPSPERIAKFWAGLLGRQLRVDGDGWLLPGDATQVGLRFAPPRTEHPSQRTVHLHLTTSSPDDRERLLTQAMDAGASPMDVGQLPEERHFVLGDPNGDPFCVIEPGNRWLDGTGLLGEVACDGTRALGQFWAAVLEWPLVWDEQDETAIQAPAGGTKVAWGGPPVAHKDGPNPQRFELVTDDLDREVARLVSLGAIVEQQSDQHVVLLDPDHNEFVLRHRL